MKPAAVLFLSLVSAGAQSHRASPELGRKTYTLSVLSGQRIELDGELSELAWEEARLETGFSFPWQDRPAPGTEFRAFRDDASVYFAFRAEDQDIVIGPGEGEEAVTRGDRVELFFASDASLDNYVCLEIDPGGRVLDYRAAYYREFDFDWDLPGLVVATSVGEREYVVEGKIPLEALSRAGLPSLLEGRAVLTGIFRAEFSSSEQASPLEDWISWVRPDSKEPDFHVPSAFGWLR